MKRLALAGVGGFLIPFIYVMVFGPLTTYIENRTVRKLLVLPVRWPLTLLEHPFFLDVRVLDSEYLIFVYIIVADVTLYSVLTYLLLWRFWKPRPKTSLPPEPPQFAAG